MNSKVKLNLYKSFCKEIEFENYLQGVHDPGTNSPNAELGRHRGKNHDQQCKLCGDECESVAHVLWECPVYDSIRNSLTEKFEKLLGLSFEEFTTLEIRQALF